MQNNLMKVTLEYNEGTRILMNGNYKKAMPIFKKIIKEYPCKEAYTNLGNCYRNFADDDKMFLAYRTALRDDIPFLDEATETDLHALNNLGLATFMYARDSEAMEYYNRAMAKKPEFWDCMWNQSTCELRMASSGLTEYFSPGWAHYESRFVKTNPVKMKNKKENLYYWDRKSYHPDEAIIVLVEQGIGDALMFGRFIPLLREYFGKIYVQCDPSLDTIFKDFHVTRDAIDTSAHWAIPIGSLAGIFHPIIPAGDWLRGYGSTYEFGSGFNVGIVWSGNPTHANDRYRSTSINRFHGLSKYCNLYSLSPSFKGNKYVKPLAISSWDDTIKYINGLDLVISVDTSVIHMVGTLGRPGIVLQPFKETDFRWGRAFAAGMPNIPVSTKSVWYDSIDIFSNPNSWEFTFANVENYVKSIAT